ncbi:MAG: Na(+)/H(+) antiporter subunit A [Phycisphaerales bacterium]|nr:putative monovalent cation/H+ antiporter subunit A [Phycisphaerales bacterium]GIK18578.1 MAG: Na(+)/H(+) antiporter subunit A [Planctomycetota bacterium]
MTLLLAVLSGFVLAPFAPAIHRALGRFSGWVIAVLPASLAALFLSLAARGEGAVVESHAWTPGLGADLHLRMDGLSLLMVTLIAGIGAAIFVYAGGYLTGHRHLGRIYAYLLMFMGSMLGVVLADNLIVLFVFWELTSVSSYLLIGFDHADEKARKSALQALLVTGLGGLAILAGALMLGSVAGDMRISHLLLHREAIREHGLYVPIVLLLVFGAFTKSAQFPFHFWLPSAMAAPTPVSAYLHSSTMVKAGIYLLARLTPSLGESELWNGLLTWFGAATMLIGAWLAFRQTTMKLILAYSTVSALGTIVMALGVGTTYAVEAAMVFLLAHAFYKGALFMMAGAIDHETGEKDVTKLGGLRRSMPMLAAAGALAALSMAGVPPMVGFIAKELAIKAVLPDADSGREGYALTVMFVAAAALGVAVALRVGFAPFFGAQRETKREAHEPPPSLLLGPGALASLGLAAAVAPGMFATPLVEPAAAAALNAQAHPHVALWHGLNLALALSGAALVLGVALFRSQWAIVRTAEPATRPLDAIGPSRLYEHALAATLGFADAQTRVLQSGSLRRYAFMTFGVLVLAVGATFMLRTPLDALPDVGDARPYEIGLVLLLLIGAWFTAVARNRLAAIAGLGLVGYGIAIIFVLFGAPDLALTQVCIETLAVVLLVLVFYMLPDFRNFSTRREKLRDLLVALAGGAAMAALVLVVADHRPDMTVSDFYAANSYPRAHGRNVVNVILVDFRALDTMGEIVVLVVAAVGVYALMKLDPTTREGATKAGQNGGER